MDPLAKDIIGALNRATNGRRPEPTEAKPEEPAVERRELSRGLRYAHFRANTNTNQLIQVLSVVEAATAMLEEKGLLERRVLEERSAAAAEGIRQKFASHGMGVQLDQSQVSKYASPGGAKIDCENRISLCQAACCKMHFALSGEDLEEGKIRWDLGRPYEIAQGDDGWCVHLDRKQLRCGVYEARPLTCRTYDCRGDPRIWLDFENRIINPEIHSAGWPRKARTAEVRTEPVHEVPAKEPAPAGRMQTLMNLLPSHPAVATWGEWFLSTYGLFLSLAFTVAAAVWLAAVHSPGGLRGALFVPGVVVAAWAGSRLLRIVEGALDGLLRGRTPQLGGHTLYGGIVAALGFAVWWLNGHANAWWLADHAAPAIALGLGIAKFGCLGSGCCIGGPTKRNPSVTYFHPLSKAAGYYGLAGVPLVPLQLYEGAFALAAATAFFLLPGAWYGEGRIMGSFLVVLSVQRTLLLPFRYRLPGARAESLVSNFVHLLFVTLGAGIIVAAPGRAGSTFPEPGATAPELAWGVLATGIVVLISFGVHRKKFSANRD